MTRARTHKHTRERGTDELLLWHLLTVETRHEWRWVAAENSRIVIEFRTPFFLSFVLSDFPLYSLAHPVSTRRVAVSLSSFFPFSFPFFYRFDPNIIFATLGGKTMKSNRGKKHLKSISSFCASPLPPPPPLATRSVFSAAAPFRRVGRHSEK